MEFDGALVNITFWARVYKEFVSKIYENSVQHCGMLVLCFVYFREIYTQEFPMWQPTLCCMFLLSEIKRFVISVLIKSFDIDWILREHRLMIPDVQNKRVCPCV